MEPKHIDETRLLIRKLNEIIPTFMETCQETENMSLFNLLNDLAPTIISVRQRLELFRDMQINEMIREENLKK